MCLSGRGFHQTSDGQGVDLNLLSLRLRSFSLPPSLLSDPMSLPLSCCDVCKPCACVSSDPRAPERQCPGPQGQARPSSTTRAAHLLHPSCRRSPPQRRPPQAGLPDGQTGPSSDPAEEPRLPERPRAGHVRVSRVRGSGGQGVRGAGRVGVKGEGCYGERDQRRRGLEAVQVRGGGVVPHCVP